MLSNYTIKLLTCEANRLSKAELREQKNRSKKEMIMGKALFAAMEKEPSKYQAVYDLMLTYLETNLEKVKERQLFGLAIAETNKKKRGRPRKEQSAEVEVNTENADENTGNTVENTECEHE